jgi:hypothetical protein
MSQFLSLSNTSVPGFDVFFAATPTQEPQTNVVLFTEEFPITTESMQVEEQ